MKPARLIAALALAAAAGLTAPALAADCSALDTGIDREKLVFYAEDGVRADAVGVAWNDLEGRLRRAEDWLATSAWRNQGVGEAIVNARHVAELVRGQVPELQAKLDAMPEQGPEFPPVFYWPEGWLKLGRAVHDSLAISADYLEREADARSRGDWDEVARIIEARHADMAGFEAYFTGFDRQMMEMLPADHPERTLVAMRLHWQGVSALYAERDRETDEEAQREITLRIATRLKEIADAIDADIPGYEAALPAYREKLKPYFLTLACDQAAAATALDGYMASYESFPDLARQAAEFLREFARIEMAFWQNGASEELYQRYDSVSYRYEAIYDRMSDQWSARARILKDAIAHD